MLLQLKRSDCSVQDGLICTVCHGRRTREIRVCKDESKLLTGIEPSACFEGNEEPSARPTVLTLASWGLPSSSF